MFRHDPRHRASSLNSRELRAIGDGKGTRGVAVGDDDFDGTVGFTFEAVGGGPDVFFDVVEVGDGEEGGLFGCALDMCLRGLFRGLFW